MQSGKQGNLEIQEADLLRGWKQLQGAVTREGAWPMGMNKFSPGEFYVKTVIIRSKSKI